MTYKKKAAHGKKRKQQQIPKSQDCVNLLWCCKYNLALMQEVTTLGCIATQRVGFLVELFIILNRRKGEKMANKKSASV